MNTGPPPSTPELTASDVVALLQFLEQNRISVCVDGGWGVKTFRR